MPVNKRRDFLERVGWTAVQATAGAILVALSTSVSWQESLKFIGITTLVAVAKVISAQQWGSGAGDALPGGVVKT